MRNNFKLTIELVPETIWFKSLRDAMSRKDWDKIRFATYAKYEHRCGVCGVHPDRLECHEIWEYDDEKHIQYLKGFIALCVMCHNIKHIGLSKMKADAGILDYAEIEKHFLIVNACTLDEFIEYRNNAFEQWDTRSQYKWKQDFGEYSNLIKGGG